MPSIKEVKNELNNLNELLTTIQAFEELSAIRTKKVKNSVFENKDFYDQLEDIYAQVRRSYKKEVTRIEMARRSKITKDRALKKGSKSQIAVLISSNSGLYGRLIRDTFNIFMKHVKEEATDIAIVGKVGKKFFQESGYDRRYQYFSMSDSAVNPAEINTIFDYIGKYKKIIVFRGKFEGILSQVPIRD